MTDILSNYGPSGSRGDSRTLRAMADAISETITMAQATGARLEVHGGVVVLRHGNYVGALGVIGNAMEAFGYDD